MYSRYIAFIVAIVLLQLIAGCAALTHTGKGGSGHLPLNEGVRDLSFLSSSEIEILETANSRRGRSIAPAGSGLLAVSRGLSLAAKERAEELARRRSRESSEEPEQRFFDRMSRYGAWSGRVAEVASYGYPAGVGVIDGLMRGDSAETKQSLAHLLDPAFTVAGVGCTSSGWPGPVCVIALAAGFTELP